MGWTVLYIAFGIVALWLLGEVLLQYKARLRWRVLAFTGFLGVVAGALIPSVVVIGVGIAAFATGQTFVTLSYRRGFVAGWALSGVPGVSRRRDEEPEPEAVQMPQFDSAPEPVPALTASGGYGSDGFQQNAGDSNGYDTAGFAAVGSMSAPSGFNSGNRYETGGFPAVDSMSAPSGFGASSGNGYDGLNGNRYDDLNGNGYDSLNGNRYDSPNGNGYETTAFAAPDGLAGPGPDGFDATQAFSPFSPETEGYQPNGFSAPNGYGPQTAGQEQVPVYQPGPMPDETGEFTFGGYDSFGYPAAGQQAGIYQDGQQYGGFSDPYAAFDANAAGAAGPSYEGYSGYDTYGGNPSYGGGDPYGGIGGIGGLGDQQGYGPQQSPYGVSDTFGGGGGFGAGGAGADAYGSMYGNGESYADGQSYFPQPPTGGAGAWVPQQRDPNEPQGQQQYPYQNGDPYGYGSQGNGYGAGSGYYY
ncbi:hypothetical protein [Streptomyces sp. WMMB 322]|uniref:hypothetical protein n=1 Tax=Streptomyces sp. WMMB 322 TaxID=1286821 RepID=UPI000823F827|nr:hypothetical protein [Streptomyces sp. WMMB 322]SCK24648.1 hypothetical protein H180DRAFT_01871 [Streptomyces sp. WMMB 322]